MWYRVVVRKGHMGGKKTYTTPAYFFAKDINEVLDRFKTMPGVKLKYGPEEVRILTKEEAKRLESVIKSDKRVTMYEVKNKWYYSHPILEHFILHYSHDPSSEF